MKKGDKVICKEHYHNGYLYPHDKIYTVDHICDNGIEMMLVECDVKPFFCDFFNLVEEIV